MSTEAKPICVVYYDPELVYGQSVLLMNISMQNKFNDYHVLAVPSYLARDGSIENIRVQVFSTKDFTEMQYEELKNLIKDAIESQKSTK